MANQARVPPFVPLVEDFLAGLGAARRSQHTLEGYRGDLLGVGRRIATQLRGFDTSADQLDVAELDQRTAPRIRGMGLRSLRGFTLARLGYLGPLLHVPRER